VNVSDYQNAIDAAKKETQELLHQRSSIDARINQLQKTIEGLSALLGETPVEEGDWVGNIEDAVIDVASLGISDAIRRILRARGSLSPVQLREQLQKEGFPINDYASGLTVIHNTLKRLQKQDEITLVNSPNGTTAFWKPPLAVPMNTPGAGYKTAGQQLKDLKAIRDKYK
jgi:hypothetical protein